MSSKLQTFKIIAFGLIIRSFIYGLAFAFIVPHINGAYFHAYFPSLYMTGVFMGANLAILHTAIWEILKIIIKIICGARLNLTTSYALIWLVIISCVIMPAIELRILARFFPEILGVNSVWAAIKSSFAFILICLITRRRGEQ